DIEVSAAGLEEAFLALTTGDATEKDATVNGSTEKEFVA
ncbi:MAG: hypothetical protein QOC80_362, partial [Frankiaceae bacterium]|nr:hypothetical protein [Frankiaceae bacterium]